MSQKSKLKEYMNFSRYRHSFVKIKLKTLNYKNSQITSNRFS